MYGVGAEDTRKIVDDLLDGIDSMIKTDKGNNFTCHNTDHSILVMAEELTDYILLVNQIGYPKYLHSDILNFNIREIPQPKRFENQDFCHTFWLELNFGHEEKV